MASLSLVLSGCLAKPVVLETETPRAARGQIVVKAGRAGHVVAAPHGSTDPHTGDIAAEIARRTGFGLVVATAEDVATGGARTYEKRVQEAAQGRLTFYVEIRGTGRRESAGRIEIATVGVDREFAQRLRTLGELIRDANLRLHPGAPRLEFLVEPADTIVYAATGGTRDGILRPPARALHLELPRVARTDAREAYTAILADFVAQAANLPAGR